MSGGIDVSGLAFAYRRLVLWFGVQLVVHFGSVALSLSEGQSVAKGILNLGLIALLIVTIIALAYYGLRTATALGSNFGWLWGFAMFVPCLNAITLLVLSSRATSMCRANNIPVGFFGPRL